MVRSRTTCGSFPNQGETRPWGGRRRSGRPTACGTTALRSRGLPHLAMDTAVVVDALEPVTLTTPGLHLRPWRPADADAVTRACQDADIQRWTLVPVPYLSEHGEEFTSTCGQRWAAGLPSFGVFDATTSALLGSHGFVSRPAPGVVEIGYWTAAAARGRGIATAATRRVAQWALRELGEHRVEWQAEVGNVASRRVAEKSGFVVEGVLRQRLNVRGQWRDAWIGGLLSSDLPTRTERT